MSEVVAVLVAAQLVLITYLLVVVGSLARRSSLWRIKADGQQVLFHQSTVVD